MNDDPRDLFDGIRTVPQPPVPMGKIVRRAQRLRRRRRTVPVTVALLLLVGVGAAAAFAQRDDGGSDLVTEQPPTTAFAATTTTASEDGSMGTTTSTSPATTVPPGVIEPLSALTAFSVDFDRLGPVVVGMTLGEAATASGVQFREDRPDPVNTCSLAFPTDGQGVWMILLDGRISAIHAAAPITTVDGIGAGTAQGEVVRIYGEDHVEEFDHLYGGPTWRVLAVSSDDSRLQGFRLVFETDGSVVTEVVAGTAHAAMLAEGCA